MGACPCNLSRMNCCPHRSDENLEKAAAQCAVGLLILFCVQTTHTRTHGLFAASIVTEGTRTNLCGARSFESSSESEEESSSLVSMTDGDGAEDASWPCVKLDSSCCSTCVKGASSSASSWMSAFHCKSSRTEMQRSRPVASPAGTHQAGLLHGHALIDPGHCGLGYESLKWR